jgi:hypothetical protein
MIILNLLSCAKPWSVIAAGHLSFVYFQAKTISAQPQTMSDRHPVTDQTWRHFVIEVFVVT